MESQTVMATARGVFDSNGGVLESKETGVSIIIPKGAIEEGIQQEIYFKVCQDNNILPPLDEDKGEMFIQCYCSLLIIHLVSSLKLHWELQMC